MRSAIADRDAGTGSLARQAIKAASATMFEGAGNDDRYRRRAKVPRVRATTEFGIEPLDIIARPPPPAVRRTPVSTGKSRAGRELFGRRHRYPSPSGARREAEPRRATARMPRPHSSRRAFGALNGDGRRFYQTRSDGFVGWPLHRQRHGTALPKRLISSGLHHADTLQRGCSTAGSAKSFCVMRGFAVIRTTR